MTVNNELTDVNTMSNLISFRLTDNEIELLENLRQGEESLNLTAARIVREKLGLSEVNSQLTNKLTSLEDLINNIITDRMLSVNASIKEAIKNSVTPKLQELYERTETNSEAFCMLMIALNLAEIDGKIVKKTSRRNSPKRQGFE